MTDSSPPLRPPHVLAVTRGQARPTRAVFFDTETHQQQKNKDSVEHTLRLGQAVHCRTRGGEVLREQAALTFTDPAAFWSWLDARCVVRSTTYLIAHNLSFDLTVLDGFAHLAARGWQLRSMYLRGQTGILRWRKGKRRLTALDNGNFFPGPLADWGETVGLDKLRVDFQDVGDEALAEYCRRDVDIMIRLWRSWYEFLDENDLGNFKPTTSSTAFEAWRHSHMRQTVHIHDDPLALELEREAYRGGRVECLWVGHRDDSRYYYLDVNGMYAHVMASGEFPLGIWSSKKKSSLTDLRRKLEKYAVVARVRLSTPEAWYPYKLDGHVCYPVGNFSTTLTTPELALALERGWIEEVGALAYYRKGRLFATHVAFFQDLRARYRKSGQPLRAKICKLLVNGLYGKFGQRGFRQEVVGECQPDRVEILPVYDEVSDTHYELLFMGGQVIKAWRDGEAYNSFPAIAAHVTALARLHLNSLRWQVPAGHVFYMDTDSLIVDEVGMQALAGHMHPTRPGALKIEAESDWLTIRALKDYSMETRSRIKGVKRDALALTPNAYKQEHFPSLAGRLRRGETGAYRTQIVTKRLDRRVTQGDVIPGGWVIPFVLEED